MPRYVTWLHISDLHFCSPTSGWKSDQVLRKLREDLQHLEEKEGLRPDFVFVTGDVAFGHIKDKPGYTISDQYEEAALFLLEVLETYRPPIPLDRLFVVPGNHDVHRGMVLESTTAWLDGLRASYGKQRIIQMIRDRDSEWKTIIRRLDAYREFLHEKLGATHLLSHSDHLIYASIHDLHGTKFGIAGLNSAWSCGRNHEKGILWLAGEWQIAKLEQALLPSDIRIALMHHPSNWFGESEDPAVTRQIEGVFHFFLHGHEHQGWITRGENHVRIAAGAAYGSTDPESGYNFVRLDLDSSSATVWLRRYVGDGKGGWISAPIPGLTDDSGRKALHDLPFLKQTKLSAPIFSSPPSQPSINPIPSPHPKNSATPEDSAASRGIYGRERAILDLSNLVLTNAVVSIYGMSGIGKTTLVREAMLSLNPSTTTFSRISAETSWTMADLYTQVARLLGNRDEYPQPPPLLLGKRDWSAIKRGSQPAVILIEHAHQLFNESDFRDPEIGSLLLAISEYAKQVHVILECRAKPPIDALGQNKKVRLAQYRVRGLAADAMAQFFRRPYPERPSVGWTLTSEEATQVADRLGGDKQGGVHPLAMELLAAVADGLAQTPSEVLERHAGVLRSRLEAELFHDLFENALSSKERRVLELCALYRDEIPNVIHANALNASVGDDHAFQGLDRRCLLTGSQGSYFLHALVRDFILEHVTNKESGHATIADAWLQTVKHTPSRSLERFQAASEAAYHILQSEQYQRLNQLKGMLQRRGDLLTELHEKSRFLHRAGRHNDNRVVLELLVALEPTDHRAWGSLGSCLEKIKGRGNDDALACHEEAHRLDPTFPPYLSRLGRALLIRNEPDRFVSIIDNLPEPHRQHAIDDHVVQTWSAALEKLGRENEASTLRMTRISAGSRHAPLYSSEARWLHSRRLSEDALKLLAQAERRGITDDYIIAVKASILEAANQGLQASALRTSRINAGGRHPILYVSEARWLRNQGQSDAALSLLSKAEKRSIVGNHITDFKLALLEELGHGEAASKLRLKKITTGERDSSLYLNEARWQHRQGRSDDALALLASAEQHGITSHYVVKLRCSILEELGRGTEASALRMSKINSGSRSPSLYLAEARWLRSHGRLDEALHLLSQAEQHNPSTIFVNKLKFVLLEELGRGEQASALRMEKINANDLTPVLYISEARWLHTQGRLDQALSILSLGEQRGIDNEQLTALKLTLLEESGQSEEASMLRMNKIDANDRTPVIYIGEARWLQRQGRAEDAIALLSLAEQRGIKSGEVIALKTTILEELGRGTEASALRMSRINAGDDNSNTFVNEARWLHTQGRSEEALFLLSLSEQRGLKNDHVTSFKLSLLEQLGKGAEASALRMERINTGSRTPSLYISEAYWLHAQGRSEEALNLLTLAEQRGLRGDHIAPAKAGILERLGRSMEASMLRMSYIRTKRRNPALYTGEALWLHSQGRTNEALSLLELADQNKVATDYTASAKAVILESMNRGAEASKLRTSFISAGSRNPALYMGEASWLHTQGNSESALTLLNHARQRGIVNPNLLALTAHIIKSLGRSTESLEPHISRLDSDSPSIEASAIYWIDSQEDQALDETSSDEQETLLNSGFTFPEPNLLEELEPQDDQE